MQLSWTKLGMIFNPEDFPHSPAWMGGFAQAPNVLIFDDYLRVYFCCRQPPDKNNMVINRCGFVDVSRADLKTIINISAQPVLSLGGLGAFDEFGTYPVSITRHENEIIAVYGGWTRCESVPFNISLGLARSSDNGVSFAKIGDGPVLSHSPSEPFVITSPKLKRFNNQWTLTYTAGRKWFYDSNGRAEIIYKLRLAQSTDGLNWQRLDQDIIPDKLNQDEAQACGDIIFSNGKYHMLFCYRKALDFRNNPNNSYRIGYAHSEDLEHWVRDDSKAGIDVSSSGWDSEMVAYPALFQLDNKVYLLYAGNGNGKTGFGLAVLNGEF